jgi:hypothetical protein
MFKADNPNTSIGDTTSIDIAEFNVVAVVTTIQPTYDSTTQSLSEGDPILIGNGWTQQWIVSDLDLDTIASNEASKLVALQSDIVMFTQKRLDDFAKTRNYDGILSACTYATSTVPKFAAEGQYAVNARDNTWATLYTALGEVQAGTRSMPTSFADVEPLLSVLTWPA